MSDAIRFENVWKEYRLGAIGGGTLKGDLQSFIAKIRGQEDPNRKIGMELMGEVGEYFYALKDITFNVPKGQAIGIIGHNGAGKSTLLKLLARVTAPTKGRIMYDGRITSMLEVGTGFHGELTGIENIYMNGAILGMTKAEIDKKIDEIVEFSEVSAFIDTPVKRYSSGMYVKLAFSVAAHLDSEIMIMDEVLAVGDARFQQKCIQKMKDETTVAGKTVLYVSHNMNTIRQLCERVVVLDHGSLIYDGDVEEAIKKYIGIANVNYKREYSLTDCPRPKSGRYTGEINLKKLNLLNTENNVFSEGDVIDLNIEVESKKNAENMSFMFIFQNLDDTRVGMSESNEFSLHEGINNISLKVPLDCLINEEYKVEISISQYRDNHHMRCDCAKEAFFFRIYTKENKLKADNWSPTNWGRMRGKPIKAEVNIT